MNITVIQNGKIKDKNIIALRDEYTKRFQRYGKLKVQESSPKPGKSLWPDNCKWRVLLDERGDTYTSEQFAQQLNQWTMTYGAVGFAIGEAYGHDEQTKTEASCVMRLSDMVLPHQLAHVLLIEQIYRAACILNNNPYHHGN